MGADARGNPSGRLAARAACGGTYPLLPPPSQALLDTFGPLENAEKPAECSAAPAGLKAGLEATRIALAVANGATAAEAEAMAAAKAERAAAAAKAEEEVRKRKEEESRWTKEELSWLAKGAKKFPAGAANRWETVAGYINHQLREVLERPKTKEGCLAKYTQIQQAAYSAATVDDKVRAPAPRPRWTPPLGALSLPHFSSYSPSSSSSPSFPFAHVSQSRDPPPPHTHTHNPPKTAQPISDRKGVVAGCRRSPPPLGA